MASTSPENLARQILEQCIAGQPWSADALAALVSECDSAQGTLALFAGLVEPLGDLFEPSLADRYVEIFSEVIAQSLAGQNAAELRERHLRIKALRRYQGGLVQKVFVLSRITLGADIAITSQFLQAACAIFSDAEIYFVGPRKNYEMFAAERRIQFLEVAYSRTGLLLERLESAMQLSRVLQSPNSLVLDPDSRLSQLGLLPVGEADNYYFFESRSFGYPGEQSLGQLTGEWLNQVFGFEGAMPWIMPWIKISPIGLASAVSADVTVSFGFGDNPAKRVGPAFELQMVKQLRSRGFSVLIDEGGSVVEMENARRIASLTGALTHHGSFPSFSQAIKTSRLYLGYDSVGQHAAAAMGIPLVTAFRGWIGPRMLQRWTPWGHGIRRVVPLTTENSDQAFQRVITEVDQLLSPRKNRQG